MIDIKKQKIKFSTNDQLINSIKEASSNKLLIVDFDETLFLRNSTAEYLNSLQPRFIGFIILKILGVLQPWNIISESGKRAKVKDWFLIFITTLLMPWNLFLWQIKSSSLAKKYSNWELIEAINKNTKAKIIVASLGFNFIINPILQNMPVSHSKLIGCRFWRGLKDRQKNKLTMVQEFLDVKQIASSVLITDSLDDLILMNEVAKPFLVRWNKAKYTIPMQDIYLPLKYIRKVKRVDQNYIKNIILFDDFPLLILAFSWVSKFPILNAIGIICLMFSFWCIYEFGYYENDLVAEKYEQKPVLKHTYYERLITIKFWQPWLWSLPIGLLGAYLVVVSNRGIFYSSVNLEEIRHTFTILRWNIIDITYPELLTASLKAFYLWFCFLLVSRLGFFIYNYINKPTRIWLYSLLQSFRYCGFLVLAKTNIVGGCIIVSQIVARSIAYIVYRYSGGNAGTWPKLPDWFLRLLLFLFLISIFSLVESDVHILTSWQTLILVLLWVKQCRRQTMEILRNIKPIWQEKAQIEVSDIKTGGSPNHTE